MTRICANTLGLLLASSSWAADPMPRTDALNQARQLLTAGDSAKAVQLLEQQLKQAGGDAAYLQLLKEAYTAYLKELQLTNKFETHAIYRKRLAILEKSPTSAQPKEVVRAAAPDDDPFQQAPLNTANTGGDALKRAEDLFAAKRYAESRELFFQAGRSGATLSPTQQSQFAYCSMHDVVERMNAGKTSAVVLEKDVRAAIAIAPHNTELGKFGLQVLDEITKRTDLPPAPTKVNVRHTEANGWKVAESGNFRVHHRQDQPFAEQILNLAEQARTSAFAKWAGANGNSWKPMCEVFIHPTGNDYAKATQQAVTAPGHSTIKCANGKVASRRMDLRADEPNLFGGTLPHEVTHVVLGDLFADMTLPRWADEGMAVLSEPRSQVERYGKTMIRLRQEGKLIPISQIIAGSEYPDAKTITVFYVESVSLVEFMVGLKGPTVFVAFLRDAKSGFEPALQRHYSLRNVADLQNQWLRATFTEIDRMSGASGGR